VNADIEFFIKSEQPTVFNGKQGNHNNLRNKY